MASNDDFESSAGSSDETVEDYKYAQLTVPNFEFDVSTSTAASSVDKHSGNSFLRLGSFPVTVSGSGTSATMSKEGDAPDGFDTSLTLAKLVGDVAGLEGYASAEDAPGGGSIIDSDPFKGNKLLGFADDTRIRDDKDTSVLAVDGATQTNSTTNRKAETKRLLTKGGWWDHSDGNRISTTAGDKIEVIQGNYKLVVLGRRAASDTGDTKVVDISGGYEFSKRYEYLESEKVWATFEEGSEVHATKKSSGKDVSYFTGTLKKTIIGEDPGDHSVFKGEFYKNYLPGGGDPEVISKTWASKVETYTGSADKPVPHVLLLTHAHAMEDMRFCTGEHVTLRSAGGSVAATNMAGINITSANLAVGNILSTNAALTSVALNAIGWAADIKLGNIFTYGSTETQVRGNFTTFKGGEQIVGLKRDELAALKTEVNNYAARVAMEATNVGLSLNNVAESVFSTSASVTNMALQHHFF